MGREEADDTGRGDASRVAERVDAPVDVVVDRLVGSGTSDDE